MRGASNHFAAIGLSMALAGCGTVDSGQTLVPEVLRAKAPAPPAPDPAPDVKGLLQSNLSAVFVASAFPTNVSFSPPKPLFAEWTTCVRATVNGATGRVIGQQIYLVNILHGQVSRRERVDASHWCTTERYQSL
jgi:hypothetical protein